MSYIKTSTFKSVQDLCDVVSVVVYCVTDSTMMLVIEPNTNEYWIPSVKVQGGNSWYSHMCKDLTTDIFGSSLLQIKLLRFNKVWMPASHKVPYISHAIFEAHVNMELKKKSKSPFGKYKGKIRWSSFDEIVKFHRSNFLKSPEIVDFISWEMNKVSPITSIPNEFVTAGNFMEITENVLISGRNNIYDQLVEASGIDRTAQETLYKEFLLMSFPSMYLTLQIFSKFLIDIGWNKEEIPNLYRSADFNSRGGISFREFLYFLSATEPGTSHGGGPAELRCRYIFRYLDTDMDNLLKRDELKHFVFLVRKSRKQPLDPHQIDHELNEVYRSIGFPDSHSLTMSEFLRAVGELKVRGTSQIYRAPFTIQKYLKELLEKETRVKAPGVPRTKSDISTVSYPRVQQYELAQHCLKIQKSAAIINIEQFWNIDNASSATSIRATSESSRKSTDKFDQNSKSNLLLKAVRYLVNLNKHQPCYTRVEMFSFSWGQLDPNNMAKYVVAVCKEVKEIFVKEKRLLEVSSPVYVLGDLHGNCVDLLNFEKIFWHVGPGLCPCNILFLGDYVDRGLFSLEVISYLFCYKLQSPKKIFLLRGNHEIKRVQIQWTFEKEMKLKFGEKLGTVIFNSINDVFDTLPLAAVIDGKVFCCHGGIPPPWLCPVAAVINDIPSMLTDPQDQSSLAWELMWNDPIRSKNMTDKIAMELLANDGFAVNSRRGTAHIFSVEALEKFLANNGYTHLVRAHEVVEAGFYLNQKGRLVTIFSTSKYCGGQNVAACLLADQGKLRVMRIEIE